MEDQRTSKQNRALHKFFTILAEELNNAGYTVRKTLKPSFDLNWNARLVKELLWRPVQETILGKESTTELSTKDIDKVYAIININLGDKLKIHVPFPSDEKPNGSTN